MACPSGTAGVLETKRRSVRLDTFSKMGNVLAVRQTADRTSSSMARPVPVLYLPSVRIIHLLAEPSASQ